MRSVVAQLTETRTIDERRQVLRIAIRQLERADIYLAAVAAMNLDDRQAVRALNQLRTDLDWLRGHLVDLRAID